jgi:hypothetical protein
MLRLELTIRKSQVAKKERGAKRFVRSILTARAAGVSEQLLNLAYRSTRFQYVRRTDVPEHVRIHVNRESLLPSPVFPVFPEATRAPFACWLASLGAAPRHTTRALQ